MRKSAFVIAVIVALGASAAMRPTPAYLKRAVVYQVVLRNFTGDCNFRAATEMLDHVRSVGVDVVYVAPFVEMDCDMDRRGWSPRQIKSGFGSPKNSYRISNYDRIDPEYGAAPLFSLAGGKPVVCVGDGEEVTAFQMDVATPVHVKVVRVVGKDATLRPEDYGTYAAIVLSGAATADDDALRAYVERGGTLIVSGDPRRQGKVLGLGLKVPGTCGKV